MSVDSYRCGGSEVWADPPFFDDRAVCDYCYQLVATRPDFGGRRFLEHSRELPSDPMSDGFFRPEFDERGAA